MTCGSCRHEFCWMCLEAWSSHGENTGGFYACNRFREAQGGEGGGPGPRGGQAAGQASADSKRRAFAKAALDRYVHYFERFQFNDRGEKDSAKRREQLVEAGTLQRLSRVVSAPLPSLKFLPDAWRTAEDSCRTLKWSYAYAYAEFGLWGEREWGEGAGGAGTIGPSTSAGRPGGASASASATEPDAAAAVRPGSGRLGAIGLPHQRPRSGRTGQAAAAQDARAAAASAARRARAQNFFEFNQAR